MALVSALPHPSAPPAAGRLRALGAQGLRFAAVGTVMTGVQLALYAVLVGGLGAQGANLVSWFLSTVATTAAHRRITFRLPGPGSERDHLVGLGTGLGGLLVSAAVLAALTDLTGNALLQAAGVAAATGVIGVGRFLVLRRWLRRGTAGSATRTGVVLAG